MRQADTSFDDTNYENAYPVNVNYHFWGRARSHIVANAIKSSGLKDGNWLEVGCGTGMVVAALRNLNIEVDGCEIAEVPPKLLLADDLMLGQDVFDLDEATRKSYQGLLLLDVLEHLPNRSEFLDRLFEAFPNAETLIVTVPARHELWSNYDTFYGHYVRYSLADIRGTKSKWSLRSANYFFHSLYIPMFLLSKLRGKRNTSVVGPSTMFSRFIHWGLAQYCIVENVVVPGRVLGTSIIFSLTRPS